MNNSFIDIGWKSLNKYGEHLCGDNVEVVHSDNGIDVVVLADGLGSGVKASILSTLTSKIISAMIAENLSVEECVSAITATLPVCEVRQIAYSTFTIIRIYKGLEVEIIQFDNPHVIMLRDGKYYNIPEIAEKYAGKTIYKSHIKLKENDTFIAISDGVIHASADNVLNFNWLREDVIKYMERMYLDEYSAKGITSILSDRCLKMYGGKPGDDTTVCTVKVRSRKQVNLLIGPPGDDKDVRPMMALFFSKMGKHIVCGGTTAALAADYLHKPITSEAPAVSDMSIPPISIIEGIDLATEGIVTINKVLEYANDYLGENDLYFDWSYGEDGASLITKLLIEEASDINFFVGRAVNPAHQSFGSGIGFSAKMMIVEKLAEALRMMGKHIKVSYF